MRIWVDFTNTAHVIVLRPLVERLEAEGHEVALTARPLSHTVELLEQWGRPHTVIGRYGGVARRDKALAAADRIRRLLRWAHGRRFDHALAHGSTDVPPVSRIVGFPNATMFDYEWAALQHHANCRLATRVLVPDAIPRERLARYGARGAKLIRYPGLKEEYYLADFEPDRAVLAELGVDGAEVLNVVRTAPSYALYLGGSETPAAGAGAAAGGGRPPRPDRGAGAHRRAARGRAGAGPRPGGGSRPDGGRPQPGRARRRAGVGRRHDEPRGGRPGHAGVVDVRGPARRGSTSTSSGRGACACSRIRRRSSSSPSPPPASRIASGAIPPSCCGWPSAATARRAPRGRARRLPRARARAPRRVRGTEAPEPDRLQMAGLEDLQRVDHPHGRGDHDQADAAEEQRALEVPVAARARRHEARKKRVGGHHQRPQVQVRGRPALGEPDAHEPVVEVVVVRAPRRPAVLEALEHHERGVEDRHREHQQRRDEGDRRGRLQDAVDGQGGQQEAERERTESPMKIFAGW
jgi:hypothetical protein